MHAPTGSEASAAGTRPELRLPIRQLIQLSLYWFGINAVWGAVDGVILQERVPDIVAAGTGGTALAVLKVLAVIMAIADPADRRHDQRLHDESLGAPQAVHLHRRDARRGVPDRPGVFADVPGRRGVRRPAPVQLELRAGPVPGLHPGSRPGHAGRRRERPRRGHVGARRGRGPADRVTRLPERSGGLHHPDDHRRGRRVPDDARYGALGPRRSRGARPPGPELAVRRGRGVGIGHPPGAQLHLARGVPAAVPHRRRAHLQPQRPLPLALACADR